MQPSLGLQTASAVGAGRGRREPLGWTVSASEVSAVHRLVYGWVTLRNAASGEWARVATGVSTRCSHESSFQSALYLFLQPHWLLRDFVARWRGGCRCARGSFSVVKS